MSYGHDKDFAVKDSGERVNYQSGMRRDTQKGKPNYRLIDLGFLRRLANHLTKGAEKYGRDNWRLANSIEELDRFKDSAFRHLMQWLGGDRDEDHGMAVVFNIMAAEHTADKMEKEKKESDTNNAKEFFSKMWKSKTEYTAPPQPDWYVKTDPRPTAVHNIPVYGTQPKPPIDIDLWRLMKDIDRLVVDKPQVTLELRSGGEILVFTFIWPSHQARYMMHYYELVAADYLDRAVYGMVITVNNQYLDARRVDAQNAILKRNHVSNE